MPLVNNDSPIASLLGNRDLALALLANSRGPNAQSFGQAFGTSALQADEMQRQRNEDELMKRYREAQIARLTAPDAQNAINPIGVIDPNNYESASIDKFIASHNYGDLQRHESPRQGFAPNYRQVTRTLKDGSTQTGSFDQRTGETTWNGPIVPPGQKARVDAQAAAEGEAAGGQGAKAPAMASFQAATQNMRQSIGNTSQGMVGGPLGSVFDYGDKRLFQSRVQQLSTELRTVFRIPGEGTLSDQEQRQYGLQLPDTSNPPDVNEQIIKDIEQRVALRQQTPIGNAAPNAVPAQPGKKRRYNPQTGKIE